MLMNQYKTRLCVHNTMHLLYAALNMNYIFLHKLSVEIGSSVSPIKGERIRPSYIYTVCKGKVVMLLWPLHRACSKLHSSSHTKVHVSDFYNSGDGGGGSSMVLFSCNSFKTFV